jgi:hypothetical protein
MRHIGLVGLLLVATVSAGGSAQGAAPPCRLITDPSGDEAMAPGHLASLDIISADLASDARNLTGVIRLNSYDVPSGTGLRVYVLAFTVPYAHKTVFVQAGEKFPDPGKSSHNFAWGFADERTGTPNDYPFRAYITGVVDPVKAEVRISLPIAELAKAGVLLKPKAPLTNLHAGTWLLQSSFSPHVDVASTSRVYRAGAASCVKPGHLRQVAQGHGDDAAARRSGAAWLHGDHVHADRPGISASDGNVARLAADEALLTVGVHTRGCSPQGERDRLAGLVPRRQGHVLHPRGGADLETRSELRRSTG